MRRLLFATLLGAALVPGTAHACFVGRHNALIHNAVPRALPQDWIVADVRFLSTDLNQLYGDGVTVEVQRMIQGDNPGRTMIVIAGVETSCSAPFENGAVGLVVGVPFGNVDGQLVVGLIEVSGFDDFRLTDDFWQGVSGSRAMLRFERRREQVRAEIAAGHFRGREVAPSVQGE